MKRSLFAAAVLAVVFSFASAARAEAPARRLPVATYVDKMAGGWIGQMVGVGWGAPTEFRFKGAIIPEERVPTWKPEMVNQFRQDDIYVEMTFLRSMELHGLDVSLRQAGIDFANSGYPLWHANVHGRTNLRAGIAPPDSGHPKFNAHADDIDYQIEADFSGLVAPGMPNVGIALGETFGRLMNYGDGLYGGQFVAGMYAEAFFEDDPRKIVEAGLACIPAESQYAETIRDVLAWHAEQPDDWQAVWQRINEKYQLNEDYRRFSCDRGDFNIDAKINGAYIVMGLLYGAGDVERTTVVSMRCGQDSDCNPSNAAGILGTTVGMKALPERYTSALDRTVKFSHTEYDFDGLLAVCENLARAAVAQQGGRIERDAAGAEVFVIPVRAAKPGKLEQCWEPGPIALSRFTEAEMAKIEVPPAPPRRAGASPGLVDLAPSLAKFAPGWKATNCGNDMSPGLRDEWGGRNNVLVTHPAAESKPCTLSRTVEVPAGKKTTLFLDIAHDPRGDWVLAIKVDGERVAEMFVAKATVEDGWRTLPVDLSLLAGKTVKIELENRANGWKYEAAYWSRIAIESE